MIAVLRFFIAASICAALAACNDEPSPPTDARQSVNLTPPPMPEDSESVSFEREAPSGAGDTTVEEGGNAESDDEITYWGVEPGEPLPLLWEDLMPQGAGEALRRQQEEFYAMLEQRYAASITTLPDADPLSAIEEGSELDYMPQLGTFDVVEDLDGQLIRIPGYVVPFDFDTERRQGEFLFVPYMGACIHTPPPPPNQIIFVRADPAIPIGDIWSPYWLEGELRTQEKRNALGDAAYTLSLETLEPYPLP